MGRILIVDDEEGIRAFLADALAAEGHHVEQAPDGETAIAAVGAASFDAVVTDLRMPGADGLAVLRAVREREPETQVVVLTAHGTVDSAVEAMKLGAFDYLQKPISGPAEIRLLIARALEHRRLRAMREASERGPGSGLSLGLGRDLEPCLTYGAPAMAPVIEALTKVAATEATVLLLGESGTGKELAARALHDGSPRADGPLVAINCAALSESLLESELFGHERGAFTGATQMRRGRIELAAGGTFFLDEVGELAPSLQAKLLRVLQERTYERIGGARTLEADVRWIAATHRDLEAMVTAGRFREDLYHRLSVFPVRLPSLRERLEDLGPLTEVLLARISAELGRAAVTLAPDALERLRGEAWPGNVRELANVLERSAILCAGPVLGADDLALAGTGAPAPTTAAEGAASPGPVATAPAPPLRIADLERDAIVRALEAHDGNRSRAAEALGIGRRTLYEKLKRYGIDA